jgi:hypothetical protein
MIADAGEIEHKAEKTERSRWSFGTAAGVAGGAGNTVNAYLLRSTTHEDGRLQALNAVSDQNTGNLPRTNIKHNQPLSFGLGVSYNINNRISLNSGLVYNLLRSEWETEGKYHTETKQYLHFVGIPLSIDYTIARWQRLRVYAAAGLLGEINIAGREKSVSFSGEDKTFSDVANVRMKEPQFSMNLRAGASYPLWSIFSIYAEIGGSYYFDNGSDMETVYSEKPFNFSPQIGLRLGF